MARKIDRYFLIELFDRVREKNKLVAGFSSESGGEALFGWGFEYYEPEAKSYLDDVSEILNEMIQEDGGV